MRRSSRMANNRRVLISEGDDDERLRKTEAKKAIIRAEFEKHKKELKVNNADPSKINEIRLKNQLEELLTGNEKKKQDLLRMENQERNLEKQNLEATQFFETMTKFNTTKANETFLSAGFYPNRTTTRLDGLKDNNTAEMLSEKKLELMETLNNLELMIEQEDETSGTVFERFEELRKNQILLGKKVNELRRMNEHSEKRFADLKRIEFLAFTKKATTESNLKELREEVRGLKSQETTYKMQKEEDKKREQDLLNAKQNEMSNILIELDKKRLEHQQKQEEVRKLELQYEDVKDKRKNTKIVTKYIEALNALSHGCQGNLMAAHKALQDFSERLDNSREFSPYKSPSQQENRTPYNFDETPRRLKSHGEDEEMPFRRDSVLDRKYYIDKIKKFYDEHPEGPEKFADMLIQQYLDECYKEESFKTLYEEQQAQKTHQENLLQTLEEELTLIKGKNEYITLGRTGSKILDSNEQEAIDSGMVVIDAQPTTLNQAKFELANKLESDNQVNLFTSTEAFVMRCYLDSIEMISRFSKILAAISQQGGMYISDDLKEVLKNITTQIQLFKKGKKSKQQELSTSQASDAPEIHRTHTENSSVSEREKMSEREKEHELSLVTLDLQEIYEIFLANFEGYTEEAAEFVSHIRSDIIISSFVTIDDIKSYIQNCQQGIYVEIQIQKAFNDLGTLRKISVENMLQKFEIIYRLYLELVVASEKANKEAKRFITVKGVDVNSLDDGLRRNSEPNVFVKKALQKKWQNLMDRYEYDPSKDYRKDAKVEEKDEQNVTTNKKQFSKENIQYDKETYDKEDVKAKLNEIGASKYKKMADESQDKNGPTLFRANEEEKKRFQAKKAVEKQKQKIDNMDDEQFLDWQRSQIKAVKEEYMYEYTEGELLMQAQADLAQRLSQTEPLAELKKMIENSKFISKIQMLEKQKSVIDGKRTLKHDFVESYIPPDPIKVPKSALSKANHEYRLKTTRSTVYTPSINSARLPSERRRTETDYDDSTKELSFRAATTKSTSRFKPMELQLNFNTARTRETDKPYHMKSGSSTQRAAAKQWPLYTDDDNKLSGKSAFSMPLSQRAREAGSNKDQEEKATKKIKEKQKSAKIDLPKLEKPKKKIKMYKKKKTVSTDVNSTEHDNLTHLLNLQTDPLLKMVYSPNYFASSGIRSMTFNDALDYQFDSYQFNKVPGLLVSEQR